MTRNQRCSLLLSAALCVPAFAAQAEDVVIGVPNWPSVQATAHVLSVAMKERLDVDVTLQEGSNIAVFEGMNAGSIHVHPEAWLPNLENLRRQYVEAAQTVRMSPAGARGEQAMCVTKDTAERTGITTLKELSDPAVAAKFDMDGDQKGDVWIGAEGWGSTPIERVRARSYGYDKTMTLRAMEEVDALAEVSAAVADGKNIVFFCYTPHHMFAEHDLVVLEEPPHDPSKWIIVPPSPTPGWFERSSAGVAWETATLHVSYASALETENPEVAKMLSKVAFDTDTVTAMTYAIAVENQDPAAFATKWVEENASVVDSWFE